MSSIWCRGGMRAAKTRFYILLVVAVFCVGGDFDNEIRLSPALIAHKHVTSVQWLALKSRWRWNFHGQQILISLTLFSVPVTVQGLINYRPISELWSETKFIFKFLMHFFRASTRDCFIIFYYRLLFHKNKKLSKIFATCSILIGAFHNLELDWKLLERLNQHMVLDFEMLIPGHWQ